MAVEREGEHVLFGFCLLAPVFCEERTKEMLGKEAMEHSLNFVKQVFIFLWISICMFPLHKMIFSFPLFPLSLSQAHTIINKNDPSLEEDCTLHLTNYLSHSSSTLPPYRLPSSSPLSQTLSASSIFHDDISFLFENFYAIYHKLLKKTTKKNHASPDRENLLLLHLSFNPYDYKVWSKFSSFQRKKVKFISLYHFLYSTLNL